MILNHRKNMQVKCVYEDPWLSERILHNKAAKVVAAEAQYMRQFRESLDQICQLDSFVATSLGQSYATIPVFKLASLRL